MDCAGRGGDLGVLWWNNVACEVSGFSQNHVDIIFLHNSVAKWRLSCFYGFPERTRCQNSWNLIRLLANKSNLPWCIMGDFNDLKNSHPRSLMEVFVWLWRIVF